MPDPRTVRLARLLVEYSIGMQPGWEVVLTGHTTAAPLLEALCEQVLAGGGYPVVVPKLLNTDALYYRKASPAQLDYVSPVERLIYGGGDAVIFVRGQSNTRELAGAEPANYPRHLKALNPVKDDYMKRTAEGKYQWAVTLYPTDGYAQEAGMSLAEYEDFVFRACHVDGEDVDPVAYWRNVSREQQRLVEWLKPRDKVVIRGQNADLSLSTKGRTFLSADGVRNMPDGEVYTGPVEDSVEGWVRFTYPVSSETGPVDGVELKFEAGKVVAASATRRNDYLQAALATDAGARYVGEFAIGTNRGVNRYTGTTLFDEKLGGTMHLALGNGYPETGSQNHSALHWDMVCDLRPGGKVFVDGKLVSENGRFLDPTWPQP